MDNTEYVVINGCGSLHSSVTSQPKTISHFTAYPKQIQFDFSHLTAYYLLAGMCFVYVVILIYCIDLIKHCEIVRYLYNCMFGQIILFFV